MTKSTRTVECPGCGVPFERIGRQKYCSRRCQARLWQRARLGTADLGNTRSCWWCAAGFHSLDLRRDYCSAICADFGRLLKNIQSKYGISREQYRATYFSQGGKCAICQQPERTARNTLLAVDHDHVTGQFRGLLCSQCNRGIGLLQDDPQVIAAAARYVEEGRAGTGEDVQRPFPEAGAHG